MDKRKRVCEGRVTSPFGMRKHPISGRRTMHNGVDIACPIGTPVLVPADGRVVDVYDHDRGGLTVIVEGNGGVRYGFCHLDTVFVKKGSLVNGGDTVALSGNSGATTGAHLHFSQKRNGVWEVPDLTFLID